MLVVPRAKASADVPFALHINGFAFMGMMLLQEEFQIDILRERGILPVLQAVTYPSQI